MKKITLLLSLAFLVFSCSEDDESDNGTNSSVNTSELVGTWALSSLVEDEEAVMLNDCQLNTQIVFTETRYTKTRYELITEDECVNDYTVTGEYEVDGVQLFVEEEFSNGETEGVFEGNLELSGGNLIVSDAYTDVDGVSFSEARTYVRVEE